MKFLISILIASTCLTSVYSKTSRFKDIMTVKGVRENPVIGYGLVIGLNGTGDGGGEITNNAMKVMFQKLGLNPQNEVASSNVASVIVTGKLPPFARVGQKIDIVVSSIGDASSLAGGTLLMTPLKGGDGKVYAVANGGVSIGGLENGKKFGTAGTVPSGATIEREIGIKFDKKSALRLSLNRSDFTTAARVEKVINQSLGGKYASARDATTIDLIVPVEYQRKLIHLVAVLENLKVEQDQAAKIIINERTGTIVAGGDIVLNSTAISHGDLTIQIGKDNPDGASGSVFHLKESTSLSDLVKALNMIGTSPDDLTSIFQALKRNGSLIGEIEMI